MKAYFLSASLLTALYTSHLCASPNADEGTQTTLTLGSSAETASRTALQKARSMQGEGELALADAFWQKAIPNPLVRPADMTDSDTAWALASHIFATSERPDARNQERMDGLMALLPRAHKVNAALILHVFGATASDINFVMAPLLSQPEDAPELINTLRDFVTSYSSAQHPLAHKGWDALSHMAALCGTPLTIDDHFSSHMMYLRAYVRTQNPLDLLKVRNALEASEPLLTTSKQRVRFHQHMAEYLILHSHFQSISQERQQQLLSECLEHWHKYWAHLDAPSATECGIYVRGAINAYNLTGQKEKSFDVLDVMPDNLDEWDLLTLIFATQLFLDSKDPTQATRYWQESLRKAKSPDEVDAFAPLVNASLVVIGRNLAMGGQLDLAIESLEVNLQFVSKICLEENPNSQYTLLHNQPSSIHDERLRVTHFLLSYAWAQKAVECTDPKVRKEFFQKAMYHTRESSFYNELECTKDEIIRFVSAMYFTIYEAGTPEERKQYLPAILTNLINFGGKAQTVAPSRNKSRGSKKTSREDQGAKARTFVMTTYRDFADQYLKKLDQMTRKLEALDTPELRTAHNALTHQLQSLKRDAMRPVIAQADARVCLETMARYNEASTKVQDYMSLWQTIERENAKARAALGVTQAHTAFHDAPYSSSQANLRGQFPHPKSGKKKIAKASTRPARPVPSSSSSPSTSSQTTVPTEVNFIFSPQANKDIEILATMPGMQTKLDAFLEEIRDNPFATKIDMATGRAEALRFMKDHYSRRFNKQNRLVYRTDRNADGSVSVTVLRLLTHYKL
ncbi:MAG: hypothetical protein C0514_05220 [Candidatus Puniceispirillum sp.]|nr:hypothetical protein [Candidatus Puniceispirillum sp.]